MKKIEELGAILLLEEDLPWTPYTPYSDQIMIKLLMADPVSGETITLLKAPMGAPLAKHHHGATVIAYTLKGAWKYKEQDWIATPGSVVFEPAAISHQAETIEGYGDEVITLNITLGDIIYYDESGNIVGIENWRTGIARYFAYCKENNIPAKDVTSLAG